MITLQLGINNIWLTSDTHYAHKNICRGVSNWGKITDEILDADGKPVIFKDPRQHPHFNVDVRATRDFSDLIVMNEAIVDRINSNVKEDDILIHNGDWSFGGETNIGEFRSKIRCKNIILIYGNHDTHIRSNKHEEQKLFKHLSDYEEVRVKTAQGKTAASFILCHYPIISWNDMKHGTFMLHGHQHLSNEDKLGPGKRMDIGMDGNDLYPYHFDEIMEIMSKRPIHDLEKDHHKPRI
jgi:calcineurin-like phosphoesterase family protein